MKTDYVKNLMDREFLIHELVKNTERLVSFIKEGDCVLNHPIGCLPDRDGWRLFAQYEWWESEANINLFEIEGTDRRIHEDLSWADLLIRESRERRKEIAQEVESCLFGGKPLPASTLELDGKIYIINSTFCTHIAVAKVMGYFLNRKRINVHQNIRLSVRYDLKMLLELIEHFLYSLPSHARIELKARSRKRIDVPAWMREETTFLFIVENKRRGQRLHLREDELIPFLKEIIKFKKSPLRRLFRNRYTKIL